MKIHNVFHPNLLRKVSTDPLTGQVNEPALLVIINNEDSGKLKTFLMLGVIEVKYNIGLSGLARMRTGIGMMLLDLIIFQKLSRIFMSVIPINHDLKKELKSEKGIDLLKRPHI